MDGSHKTQDTWGRAGGEESQLSRDLGPNCGCFRCPPPPSNASSIVSNSLQEAVKEVGQMLKYHWARKKSVSSKQWRNLQGNFNIKCVLFFLRNKIHWIHLYQHKATRQLGKLSSAVQVVCHKDDMLSVCVEILPEWFSGVFHVNECWGNAMGWRCEETQLDKNYIFKIHFSLEF